MKQVVVVLLAATAFATASQAELERPVAVSPGSSSEVTLSGPCPTFDWGGVEGARAYEIVVYRIEEGEDPSPLFAERLPGAALGWSPALSRCLEAGGRYAWVVRAILIDGMSEWSEPLLFQVAEGPSQAEVERALVVVEQYLAQRLQGVTEGGQVEVTAAEPDGVDLGAVSPAPMALGGADFSIDSSGNVAGLSFSGDGAGLANVTATNLVAGAVVSVGELDFDPATQTELESLIGSHAHAGEAIVSGTVGEAYVHSSIARDTEVVAMVLAGDGEGSTLDADTLDGIHAAALGGAACTLTNNGDGTMTLDCDGVSRSWYRDRAGAVSSGTLHACALKSDGWVDCWGQWAVGGSVADPLGPFVQSSTGGDHDCGLRLDGTVFCWGRADGGRTAAPGGLFTQVSAGGNHSCALRQDGSVECWGVDNLGCTTPPAATTFTQVSAGEYHTCGVTTGGDVACWGNNVYGQSTPTSPPIGTTYVYVSAGLKASCGLTSERTIVCWGDAGVVGSVPTEAFSQVEVGWEHACGRVINGTVLCWGEDGNEQASPPEGSFYQVSAGMWHSCGVKSDGTVVCWGSDYADATSVPSALQ